MHTEQRRSLEHGDLTERIIGVFYDVYNELLTFAYQKERSTG